MYKNKLTANIKKVNYQKPTCTEAKLDIDSKNAVLNTNISGTMGEKYNTDYAICGNHWPIYIYRIMTSQRKAEWERVVVLMDIQKKAMFVKIWKT